jgi:hypothetical protein
VGDNVHKRVKIAVWERDEWRCRYCDVEIVRAIDGQPADAPNTATVDHVQPRSKGGSDGMANLVAACFRCNQDRKDIGDLGSLRYSPSGWRDDFAAPTLGDVWPGLSAGERKLFGRKLVSDLPD